MEEKDRKTNLLANILLLRRKMLLFVTNALGNRNRSNFMRKLRKQ